MLANKATYYLVSGKAPVRMGNAHASVVPYQTFPTTDGWMLIACGNDGQFVKMMQILGDPAMAHDERYKTNAGRVVNRETLIPWLFELTKKLSKAELAEQFEAAGVAGGTDQHAARGVQRPAGDRPRHAGGPAASDAKGGMYPGRPHADHHQRPPRRRRPRAA